MTQPKHSSEDRSEEINMDALIGNLRKLEEHIKDFSVRLGISNVIESALWENLFIEDLIVERLCELVGEEAAKATFWVLCYNDLSFIKKLMQNGLSTEVGGFLLELVSRLGRRLEERIEAENSPNKLVEVKSFGYYMPETKATWMSVRLRRTDGQTYIFDGTVGEIFSMLQSLFKSIVDVAKETQNKIPDVRFEIDFEKLEQHREDLITFQEIVKKQEKQLTEDRNH